MSNYLKEEILPNKFPISTWKNTKDMFQQICSNEKIALVLYEMLGHSEFVLLLETNSTISKSIKKHSHIQLILLKLKISKLKERQLRRQSIIFLGVDYVFFNPFTFTQIPVNLTNQEELAIQNMQRNQQIDKQIQKINNNNLAIKYKWKTFSSKNSAPLYLHSHPHPKETVKQIQVKPTQLSDFQKLQIISKAESMLQTKKLKRQQLMNQTKKTQDKLQSEKRERFVQRYFGEDNIKQTELSMIPQIERYQKEKTDSLNQACLKIIQFGQFKESLWTTVSRKIENSIFGYFSSKNGPTSHNESNKSL